MAWGWGQRVRIPKGADTRTGVCNPGGIFTELGYEPWMIERALSAGHHCGSHGIDIIHGLPTG